jgi:hypothetical protein
MPLPSALTSSRIDAQMADPGKVVRTPDLVTMNRRLSTLLGVAMPGGVQKLYFRKGMALGSTRNIGLHASVSPSTVRSRRDAPEPLAPRHTPS